MSVCLCVRTYGRSGAGIPGPDCRPVISLSDAAAIRLSVPCPSFKNSHGRQRHWNIGGSHSQVERRRRENRGAVGGEGVGCAPSQKIYEFFISKWCDENDSDLRYSEVPLKGKIKHLSKYWTVVNAGGSPATPAALTPIRTVHFTEH